MTGRAASERRFYRIVKSNPPTEEDFQSHAALGRVPPRAIRDDPEKLRSWECVSVFDTEAGARRVARTSREMRLGRFIAELLLPGDQPASITYDKTLGSHGHYDMTAEPVVLLALVVRVVPV
jgi:hypothetical protein